MDFNEALTRLARVSKAKKPLEVTKGIKDNRIAATTKARRPVGKKTD